MSPIFSQLSPVRIYNLQFYFLNHPSYQIKEKEKTEKTYILYNYHDTQAKISNIKILEKMNNIVSITKFKNFLFLFLSFIQVQCGQIKHELH